MNGVIKHFMITTSKYYMILRLEFVQPIMFSENIQSTGPLVWLFLFSYFLFLFEELMVQYALHF